MKKIIQLSTLVIGLFIGNRSYAQMAYTCPNPSNSPFVSILGTGETIGLGFGLQNNDDAQTGAIDLNALSAGFRFYLSGSTTAYRYMGLSVNGWCWFSATGGWAAHNYSSLSTPSFSTWVNNFTNVRDAATFTYKPVLSCFWDDLTLTSSGNSKVAYKITGVSPNRILTIEWNKVQRYPDFSGNGAASFQIIIRENPLGGTNASLISYNYFNEGTFSSAISASIGILGTCPGDFYSLNNSGTTPIASQTVETTNINAFAANGQLYRFTGAVSASAVNDDICNATSLLFNTNSTCNTIVGTTKGATVQAFAVTGGAAGGACLSAPSNRDVWYTVIKPIGTTTMIISTDNVLAGGVCSSGGVQFQVYTNAGSCAAPVLTEITGGCSNNGGVLNPLNSTLSLTGLPAPATNYWIRVSGDADAQLDFQICVKNASNDNVCGAVDLGLTPGNPPGLTCIPFSSTTVSSTKTRGAPPATPANYLLAQSANNFQTLTGTTTAIPDTGLTSIATRNDVWFKFKTSLTNSDYVIDTYSGSLTDAQMAIYAGPLNCGTNPPSSSGTYFRTGTLNNAASTFPSFRSFIDDKTVTDFMPRIIATNLALNTTYYIRVWRKNVTTPIATYPTPTGASSVGTTITCSSTTGLGIGMVVTVSAGTGVFASNPSTTITSIVNATTFTVSTAPTTALVGATIQTAQGEGTFTICVYERPTCGVKSTCSASAPFTPSSFTLNPNGNYNGTKCTTPIALPNDTNGICSVNAPKIPTIGTNFAPLCGDNYKGPGAVYAITGGLGIGVTTVTLSSGNTNNILVGSLVYQNTGAGGILPSNVTVTGILSATQFTISAGPTFAFPVAAASALFITSDSPLNSSTNTFGNNPGSGAGIPNFANPMFYRVKNDLLGSLTFNFSNVLSPNNNGIRAALYTLTVAGVPPSSPNYTCTGGTWTLYPASSITNLNGTFPNAGFPTAGKLYGNTPTGTGNFNPGAVTGPNNTDKFSMTYSAIPPGIYYLLIDGASADKAYFDMTLTGTAASGNGVLPITLLQFTGKNSGGLNTLNWSTASEVENDYFTLERSFNGINFEPIAQIDGAGNSNSVRNYTYTDKRTSVGVTYYRLKQTDFNTRTTYSEIVALYSKTGNVIEFSSLRPNPTNGNFYIDLVTYENTTLTFEVRDVAGKLVQEHNASANQGENSIETSLDGLESGLYFVKVSDLKSGDTFIKKVVKQ